jgi:hypothetical protein
METAVRTKFLVDEKSTRIAGTTIHFSPVKEGSEENVEHFKKLPAGGLELIFSDEEMTKQFNVGDHVYVDISPASL